MVGEHVHDVRAATAATAATVARRREPPATRRRRAAAWVVSLVATGASTYALEALATAAGLLLVTSGMLDGRGRPFLVGLLVVSYGVWGLGLSTNLRANHELLTLTGTSTNVLSKAGHDLALARSAGARIVWLASAGGYLTSELAKEVPYYAGAFGASAVTDAVTSSDALVFLIGTNLGAGAYEHVLGRLTRLLLSRR